MTLVAALRCADGVLLASESCEYEEDCNIKNIVAGGKQRLNASAKVAIGCAGYSEVASPLLQSFGLGRITNNSELLGEIKLICTPLAQTNFEIFQGRAEIPWCESLLVGIRNNKPYTTFLSQKLTTETTDEGRTPFKSIGCAKDFAYACYIAYGTGDLTLDQGKVVLMRIMEDSIANQKNIGHPINMDVIPISGDAMSLTVTEIEELSKQADTWRKAQSAIRPFGSL